MLRNYFRIAWRNLLKNKGLSFINIFGLATGMAFAMLIGLWILYPSLPFEYNFADEAFDKKFLMENQAGKLAAIFAGLAIFISCLGLFGLAMFVAERRTKEIGVRKVLGASVANFWILLSEEFVWLVMVACLIASPVVLWLMNGWLQKYD